MKHLLLTTIAAVLVVGCGESQQPEPPTAKAPDISIHEAVAEGNIEAVKQAIADGADVNAKGRWGSTPLHHTALGGHKEITELLIAKGADVNAKGDGVKTPLDVATHPDNPNDTAETADLLRKHGGKTGEELKAKGK
jgi:ankyrin repeat protein